MLAREDTAGLLARAILSARFRSRAAALEAGLAVTASLLLFAVWHQPVSAAVVLAVLLLSPVGWGLHARSAGRALAPAGFTLGLGLGQTHLAVRHAVATVVSPYSSWQSAARIGEVVALVTRRGGLLVVPAELIGAQLPRLQTLIRTAGDAEGDAERVTEVAGDLPLAYECDRSTRPHLVLAALVLRVRRPAALALLAVDLLAVVLVVLSPRSASRGMLLICLGFSLVVVGIEAVSAWQRLATSCRPGMVIRGAMRDDALVVGDATGTATVPFHGIATMTTTRHAIVLRSRIKSVIVLPRPLLTEPDIARMRGAIDYYRDHR